jgi:hypothetical protein
MSDVNRNKLRALATGCRDEVIRSHGWEGTIEEAELIARDRRLLMELSPEVVIQLLDDYDALQAEREQLRAELAAIRGQEPVAWMHCRTGAVATADTKNMMEEGAVASGYDVPLYALPPQQPDAVSVPSDPQPHDYRQDLQCWFGLGRASWCTIPRVLMEAMPEEWQRRAAILLHEYSEAFPDGTSLPTPYVQARVDGKITHWPDWITNYRHPDRAAIDGLRLSTRQAEEGQPCEK